MRKARKYRMPTVKLKVYTRNYAHGWTVKLCILRGNDFYVIIIMQFFMKKFRFGVRSAARTELN